MYILDNEKASEAQCECLMSVISDSMTERINQGFYAKAGGYDLFCQDLEEIVNEYKLQACKEVKVINVISYNNKLQLCYNYDGFFYVLMPLYR